MGDMVSFLPHGDMPEETDETLDLLRKGVTLWHGRITELWAGKELEKAGQSAHSLYPSLLKDLSQALARVEWFYTGEDILDLKKSSSQNKKW